MALTQTRQPNFVESDYLIGGNVEWSDTTNAISDNGVGAFASVPINDVTEGLWGHHFGFNIPGTATIEKIVVRIRGKALELYDGTSRVTAEIHDYDVRLTKHGTTAGTSLTYPSAWKDYWVDAIYQGGLWGSTWTPAEVNSNGFGVALAVFAMGDLGQVGEPRVDSLEITVHYFTEYEDEGDGGATAEGISVVDPELMDGGVFGNSPDQNEFIDGAFVPPVDGGILASGSADVAWAAPAEGGALAGGVATESHDAANESSGGAVAEGEADVDFFDIFVTSGGVQVSGEPTSHNFYGADGGALVHGSSDVKNDFSATGAVLVGGEVIPVGVSNEPRDGVPSGILAGGSSQRSSTSSWSYEATGYVLLGTATNYGMGDIVLSASGSIYVSNVLDPVIVNVRFNRDYAFEWRTKAFISKDITFRWNTGQLTMYWYRVIGKGRQGDECDLVADPCCQKFIVNVHARTAAELCEKLSERNWNWPIESVQQFSRPAETELADDYIDEYGECNELIPLEICEIPQCADFCVDHDLRVTFNFTMSQSVDAFYNGDGDGTGDGTVDPMTKAVFIGGAADTILDKDLPDYIYSPTIEEIILDDFGERQLYLSGEAQASPSDLSSRGGGVKLGGETQVGFPRHEFVGGVWPSQTTFTSASNAYTWSVSGSGLVPWNYPERVLLPDGTNAEADISFRYTTEYLIVDDLKLNLPTDINILGIKVYVHRWSTQTALRDFTLQLMDGTSAYSNNLARPAFTWPLIATTAWYGSDGLDGSDPFVPLDGTWDVSVLNGRDFGIGIQVEEFGNNPGSYAYVDYFSMEVFYEAKTNQVLRIGGSSLVKSEVYAVEGNGGIQLAGGAGHYRFDLRYLPTGIGLNQPTSFLISGSHATDLYYEVAEMNTVWWDKGDPVVEANKGTVAYWSSDATSQSRGDILGTPVPGTIEWQDPEEALVADISYAYADLGNTPYASDFLVVRNIGLDLDPHFKIHGIRIIIGNRFGSKPSIYDEHVYLVRSNSIISDNFAKNQIWDEIPETIEYGSTGFDEESQLRDTELNPWDVDDVNDPEFGLAIAAGNLDTTADTFAKIDGIAFELTVEAFAREEVEQAHIRIMGSADAWADPHISQGGLSASGFADVQPYWVTMDGGVSASGVTGLVDDWVYDPADGTWDGTDDMWHVRMGGSAVAYFENEYVGIGGSIVGGAASVASNRFDYTSDGNAIFILGSADQKGTDLKAATIKIGGDMVVLGIGGVYLEIPEDEYPINIDPLIGTVPSCGCLSVPLSIALRHNLNNRNIFTQFLIRNDLHLDGDLELFYNVPNDSWQYNAHFVGYSADADTREKWDLVFEVQCTEEMGGVNIGRKIWKAAVGIFRKNLTTGEDFDTRIVFGVLPQAICDTNANELDFEMTYNTQLDFATVFPENAVIYQATLYDNIGMFKNQYWVNAPNLTIAVSQSGFALPQTRHDIYSTVVQPDEAVPVPSS